MPPYRYDQPQYAQPQYAQPRSNALMYSIIAFVFLAVIGVICVVLFMPSSSTEGSPGVAMMVKLGAGATLTADKNISSPNGKFQFHISITGSMYILNTITGDKTIINDVPIEGDTPAYPFRLVMQTDGNLVLYGGADAGPKWSSSTTGSGLSLIIDDNGYVVILNSDKTSKKVVSGV